MKRQWRRSERYDDEAAVEDLPAPGGSGFPELFEELESLVVSKAIEMLETKPRE